MSFTRRAFDSIQCNSIQFMHTHHAFAWFMIRGFRRTVSRESHARRTPPAQSVDRRDRHLVRLRRRRRVMMRRHWIRATDRLRDGGIACLWTIKSDGRRTKKRSRRARERNHSLLDERDVVDVRRRTNEAWATPMMAVVVDVYVFGHMGRRVCVNT